MVRGHVVEGNKATAGIRPGPHRAEFGHDERDDTGIIDTVQHVGDLPAQVRLPGARNEIVEGAPGGSALKRPANVVSCEGSLCPAARPMLRRPDPGTVRRSRVRNSGRKPIDSRQAAPCASYRSTSRRRWRRPGRVRPYGRQSAGARRVKCHPGLGDAGADPGSGSVCLRTASWRVRSGDRERGLVRPAQRSGRPQCRR